jgi:hypothetical protein
MHLLPIVMNLPSDVPATLACAHVSLTAVLTHMFQEEFYDAGGVEGGTLSAEQFDDWKERFKVKLGERMDALAEAKQSQTPPPQITPPAPAESVVSSDELETIQVEVRGDASAGKPEGAAGGGCCAIQ